MEPVNSVYRLSSSGKCTSFSFRDMYALTYYGRDDIFQKTETGISGGQYHSSSI